MYIRILFHVKSSFNSCQLLKFLNPVIIWFVMQCVFVLGVYAFGFLFMLPQLFVNYKVSV